MFAPESASWGVTGSYVQLSIRHGYGDSLNLPNLSIQTENFEA